MTTVFIIAIIALVSAIAALFLPGIPSHHYPSQAHADMERLIKARQEIANAHLRQAAYLRQKADEEAARARVIIEARKGKIIETEWKRI